jgi:hypothetical protein
MFKKPGSFNSGMTLSNEDEHEISNHRIYITLSANDLLQGYRDIHSTCEFFTCVNGGQV